ncbi:AHH domain-containing protein [Shewanella sp. 6_MG-2023]|uniref:AHH domain-containing protein n=1 Tax=Shewanella sp. 6_MG-2023 TaxID=3062660 RepID=UPI0026E2E4A8|nr:AHH domain-containing protein [Shewanella sp. 6_MG-2023]MDO6621187.1 AHH domain-containing protein [Shewanella sp. 6_MG-2023]
MSNAKNTKLRKLGGKVGDGMQGHHVIPQDIWGRNQGFLNDIGMGGRKNKPENGILLPNSAAGVTPGGPKAYHSGSHSNYSEEVNGRLNKIQDDFYDGKYDKRQARDAVRKEQMKLKNGLFNGDFSNGCGRVN